MLPEPFKSMYGRYKHDTAVITSWLVQTAQKHGYPAPLQAEPKAKSARLKGKARKQMQMHKTAAAGRADRSTSGRKRTLATKDFVSLAEFIASVREPKPVSIPPTFTTTLNRVIRVRKSFSTWFEKEKSGRDADSDAKHLYFISILERVRDILQPLMDTLDLSAMYETVSGLAVDPASALEVYKLPEASLHASDMDLPVHDYVLEPEDTMEDAYFAFYILFHDALSLRSRARELWSNYRSGTLHLAAVSVAANTTIHLVRQMEEDIAPLVAKHGGFTQFLHFYFTTICMGQGKDYRKRERPGDDINLDTYDIADRCMFNAWHCLDAFRRAHSPGHAQVYNGQFGEYDPGLDSAQLSSRMRYQQDKAALLEMLGDCTVVASALETSMCEDGLTHGVRLMLDAGEVPFWVTFAAQVFLDTLRCLQGPAALQPSREMQAWNATVAGSIHTAMAFHHENKLHIENWPPPNNAILEKILGDCSFWASDPIGALKQRHGLPPKPSVFLQRHAMFCGLWVHSLRASFHEAGTIFAAAWGATLCTGHLYHAMRREAPLEVPRWDDMELLLALQGAGAFFAGGPPRGVEGDFENYCLCMGYPAPDRVPSSRRQKKGRQPALVPAAGPPRTLRTQADVSMRFMQLLHAKLGGMMTTGDVKLILAASQWAETREGGQIVLEKEPSAAEASASREAAGKQKDGPGRREATPEATPAALVRRLALVLQAEIAELSFDYFSMHVTCWKMLGGIREHLDGKLRELFTLDYLEDASQLPFIVGYIFMAAARKMVWPGEEPLGLMRMAMVPVKRVIERNGHRIQDELKKVGVVFIQEESESEDDSE